MVDLPQPSVGEVMAIRCQPLARICCSVRVRSTSKGTAAWPAVAATMRWRSRCAGSGSAGTSAAQRAANGGGVGGGRSGRGLGGGRRHGDGRDRHRVHRRHRSGGDSAGLAAKGCAAFGAGLGDGGLDAFHLSLLSHRAARHHAGDAELLHRAVDQKVERHVEGVHSPQCRRDAHHRHCQRRADDQPPPQDLAAGAHVGQRGEGGDPELRGQFLRTADAGVQEFQKQHHSSPSAKPPPPRRPQSAAGSAVPALAAPRPVRSR